MSILQVIEQREKDLIEDAAYWKDRAAYWEKRYWDETMAGIKHNEEMFAHLIIAAINVDTAAIIVDKAHDPDS